MGAKTSMLVYSDGNARSLLASAGPPDRHASGRLLASLFPGEKLEPLTDGSLTWTYPSEDELYVGSFEGVDILAATEIAVDRPSKLDTRFLKVSVP